MELPKVHSEQAATVAAKAAQKADFADRLKTAIERKGWSMSETARRVSSFLGDGEKFGRAHVWHYVQGRALPRYRYLEALSLALNVRPDELMPVDLTRERNGFAQEGGSPASTRLDARPTGERFTHLVGSSTPAGMVHVRDYGDGTALLEISERVPWETALAVLQIVKKTAG
jgi:transcriptional regulator with XRE-family HTH domain